MSYGLNLSATRKIYMGRKNLDEVSRIAFNVLATKALLCAPWFYVAYLFYNLFYNFYAGIKKHELMLLILY